MHLGRAVSLFSVIPVFVTNCLCLPVNEHRSPPSQALAPRATYSVVPIDGGSGPGGSGPGGSGGSDSGSGSGPGPGHSPTGAVTVTIVATLPPKTSFHTIYVASPPTTERITDTLIVTKTIEIVNISPRPTTTTTTTATTSYTSTTQSVSTTSPQTAPLPTSVPAAPDSATISQSVTSWTSITTPIPTALSSSTTTYDDGKWHMSYPAWNGTLARRGSRNWLRPKLTV